ncbi:MAG TPA: nitric oxide reductase, partial [Thauera aminoaromatica]|nr:nitric oxide reductase [Thauera aminoaromatica]
MEETVGLLWHRLITRAAGGHFPKAAVRLRDIEKTAGVFFRALGGDPGLRLAAATTDEHGARRSLLQRIAGADERVARARMDVSTLRLPPELDVLPERGLNRDLYLWLAAVAAAPPAEDGDGPPALGPVPDEPIDEAATRELRENQAATLRALARWPGIEARYRRLVDAVIAQRPRLDKLPPAEAEREKLIRLALHAPGSVAALRRLPAKARATQPVLLWLSEFHASAAGGSG